MQKNWPNPDIKFLLHTVGAIGKSKWEIKSILRKCTSNYIILMSYYYIDAEIIIGKLKNIHFYFKSEKIMSSVT